MLSAFYHPGYAAPLGVHRMPIGKFALLAEALSGASDVRLIEPLPVTEEDLRRVHTKEYIEAIRTGEPRDLAQSQKFPWSPALWDSVKLTSGGCLAAARQALRDGVSAALVSGFHHAFADHGEGFCTFNGLIVTLDALLAAGEIRTAAVLDLDLHYGNGTASLATTRPSVFALSVYGNDYRGNTAYGNVTTRLHEDGPNHRSFALPSGCDRKRLLEILAEAFSTLLERKKPDLLLFQAGADPYWEDPYSTLALDHDDLRVRDSAVFEFTRQHEIPVAWVLAGGYTPDIHKIVQVHLGTFEAWRRVYAAS